MAADRSQMLTSPAYAALSPSARKVLALIDSKVAHGGGVAAISFSYIERQCGMIHGTCGFGRIVHRGGPAVRIEALAMRRFQRLFLRWAEE